SRLTVTGDVSNFGTIRLESTSDDGADRGSYLTVGGTLTNAAGGVVEANVGAGDARSITGSVLNRGTLVAGPGQSFTVGGPGATFTQEAGSVEAGAGGQVVIDRSRVELTGGHTAGTVRAFNATIHVGPGVTEPSVLRSVG